MGSSSLSASPLVTDAAGASAGWVLVHSTTRVIRTSALPGKVNKTPVTSDPLEAHKARPPAHTHLLLSPRAYDTVSPGRYSSRKRL
jgi:hypothetical protein